MKKTVAILTFATLAAFGGATFAADDMNTDKNTAQGAEISKDQAKKLNTQSTADYKARGKVAEANEDLNKADCKNSMDGSAKRACEKSAKAQARSEKADAKTLHEAEKKQIKDAATPPKN